MPKNRIRTTRGRRPKLSKADEKKIGEAYNKKYDEYDEMELEKLLELQKSKKVKGTYARALDHVIKTKRATPKEKAA